MSSVGGSAQAQTGAVASPDSEKADGTIKLDSSHLLKQKDGAALDPAFFSGEELMGGQNTGVLTTKTDQLPAKAFDKEVRLYTGSYTSLVDKWDERRRALRFSTVNEYEAYQAVWNEESLNLGFRGLKGDQRLIHMAKALLIESQELMKEEKFEEAKSRIELAGRLAPEAPEVNFQSALYLLKGENDPAYAAKELGAGLYLLLRNPVQILHLGSRLILALLITPFIIFLCFAALLFFRYFSYLILDVKIRLPRGTSEWQVGAILFILLVWLCFISLDFFLTALFLILPIWIYLSKKERSLVFLLLILLGVESFFLDEASLWITFSDSQAVAEYDDLFLISETAVQKKYEGQSLETLGPVPISAMAHEAFRQGDIEESFTFWETVHQRFPNLGWPINNMGVAKAILGETSQATALFEKAVEVDPTLPAAFYNGAMLGLRNVGQSTFMGAPVSVSLERIGSLLERYKEATKRDIGDTLSQNRLYILSYPLPKEFITNMRGRASTASSVAGELRRVLLGGLSKNQMILFSFSFFILALLYQFGTRSMVLAKRCGRCLCTMNVKEHNDEVPHDVCSSCFYHIIEPDISVKPIEKVRKEQEIFSNHRRNRRLRTFFTVLLPGAGHIYAGAPWTGTVLALCAASLGSALVVFTHVLPWPYSHWEAMGNTAVMSVLGILVILYPFALWGALRVKRSGHGS